MDTWQNNFTIKRLKIYFLYIKMILCVIPMIKRCNALLRYAFLSSLFRTL